MNAHDMQKIDALVAALDNAALRAFVQICPECRTATTAALEVALDAIRASGRYELVQMVTDARDVPALASAAFAAAAFSMAQAGATALRANLDLI